MELREGRSGWRWLWAALLVGLAGGAWAQGQAVGSGLRLRDLTAQNAVKLAAAEVQALASGATVQSVSAQGNLRTWKDSPDGQLIASASGTGLTLRAEGKGTWHVAENGTYCVQIEWKTVSEQWCLFIYRVGERTYGVRSEADLAAPAWEIKFIK